MVYLKMYTTKVVNDNNINDDDDDDDSSLSRMNAKACYSEVPVHGGKSFVYLQVSEEVRDQLFFFVTHTRSEVRHPDIRLLGVPQVALRDQHVTHTKHPQTSELLHSSIAFQVFTAPNPKTDGARTRRWKMGLRGQKEEEWRVNTTRICIYPRYFPGISVLKYCEHYTGPTRIHLTTF